MADRLARIFGTEEDKVNCPFYFKIGACRHGDTCTRLHNKPVISQTILLPHLYDNPPSAVAFADGLKVPEDMLIQAIGHFEDFYEEVWMELAKFGELEELNVCDNIGEHLIGNVYVKYQLEEDADKAFKGLKGRYYSGKPIQVEFSPVTDFDESRCRLFKEGSCDRGGYCNFMHLKHVNKDLQKDLSHHMYSEYPEYKKQKKKRKEMAKELLQEKKPKKSKKSKKLKRSRSRSSDSGESQSSKSRSRSNSKSSKSSSSNSGKLKVKKSNHKRKSRRTSKNHSNSSRSRSSSSQSSKNSKRSSSSSSSSRSKSKKSSKQSRIKKDHKKSHSKKEKRGDLARQTSEERRAIIEAWNNEKENKEKQEKIEARMKQSFDPRASKIQQFKKQNQQAAAVDPLKQMIMQLTTFPHNLMPSSQQQLQSISKGLQAQNN